MPVHVYAHRLFVIAVLATVYFLTAKLGFLLTIPPGNVSPLWPPSGIAVAAAFIFGRHSLPGVFIGSFAVNAQTMTGDAANYVALAIAFGSTLQAGLSAFCLHRYLPEWSNDKQTDYPTPDSAQSVILFVIACGFSAMTAPTVGASALQIGGYIALDTFVSVWWTWWLGDFAGILTIAPVLIVIALKLKKRSVAEATLFPLSTLWFGLSLIIFFVVYQLERRETDAKLQTVTQNVQQRLDAYFRTTQLNLLALSGFFSANQKVESRQYTQFVTPLLKEKNEIIGINWVPYVRAADVPRWIAEDGQLSRITALYEISGPGQLPRPIAERPDYFPILFLEPKLPQFRLEGLDLGADSTRRATLERARDTNLLTLTPPLRLYRDDSKTTGLMLIMPVYVAGAFPRDIEQRRAAIKGFAIVVLNADNIVNALKLDDAMPASVRIDISDITDRAQSLPIYSNMIELNKQQGNRLVEETHDVNFGERTWRLHLRTLDPLFSASTWRSWLLLLFGIAMSSIVTAYINIRRKADRSLLESEKFSRSLFEAAPDAEFVINQQGQIVRLNAVAGDMFACSHDELLAQSSENIIAPDSRLSWRDSLQRFFAQPSARFTIHSTDLAAVRKDGHTFPVDVVLSPFNMANTTLAIAIFRDVSERETNIKQIESLNTSLEQRVHERTQELQETQIELTALVSALERKNHEISLLSELSEYLDSSNNLDEVQITLQQFLPHMLSDTRGQVFFYNEPSRHMKPVVLWGSPELPMNPIVNEDCWSIKRNRPYIWSSTAMLRCAHCNDESSERYVCAPIIRQGNLLGFLHVRSEQHVHEKWDSLVRTVLGVADQLSHVLTSLILRESLQQQAVRDVLTGLFNRRFLDETLQRELTRARRGQETIAIAMIDIDFFKKVNDTYGHSAGDTVLETIANHMQNHVRASDIVGRFGGEEFMIIMPDTDQSGAVQRLETMRELIATSTIAHQQLRIGPVTISIGIAFCLPSSQPDLTAAALIEMADKALYQSKQQGRNRLTVFSSNIIEFSKPAKP